MSASPAQTFSNRGCDRSAARLSSRGNGPGIERQNRSGRPRLLLTNARRLSIVSCMANHSPQLDNVFGALADPTRRALIARLSQGEASVSELAQPFDMALPSLMKHIRVLETGGLVESEKHGRVRTCRLMPGAMKGAETWLAEQRAIWEARLDRLEAYLAMLERKPPRRRRLRD